ncbi:MAG: DUF2336 domain-containing protein [Rhodospirillaceae bacterium]|nr:DUF2336 domain-containing protein [Rhodospirillaceae bacterium]MBT4690091.1 DUF2336 domain-containing protein [Rhodospirillaceae bacterium]MBT5082638.1 DUF2336 domain-containing protein [Rhodospirillaceae bacterium]MBT5526032.1 DUF2336 domain-containing protein [Rhodospirillaceae bacterium]MBT5878130.1 DUF2336 domain-containing protein [Rhodospirillaceae bacterium]
MAQLTADLITRLREEGSPEVRRETVALLTNEFCAPDALPSEQRLAESIFRIMARDTDVAVRRALAEGLKDSPEVPSDLAMTLAKDVAEVATPMLHYSLVFTEQELIEIARSQPEAWQQAVARREKISAPVSDALVEAGNENVVVTLVRNQGAEISDDTSNKVIDRFPNSEDVMTGLVRRPNFSPQLAERLLTVVSEALRQRLAAMTDLAPAIANQLVTRGQETMTLDIGTQDSPERQPHLDQLVRQLDVKGRLTPALIIRSLCTGHFGFFETAAARRAGIDPDNARALIANVDAKSVAALCKAAKLPRAVAEVVTNAKDLRSGIPDPDSTEGREAFQNELIERCRGRYPDLVAGKPDSLIAKLAPF